MIYLFFYDFVNKNDEMFTQKIKKTMFLKKKSCTSPTTDHAALRNTIRGLPCHSSTWWPLRKGGNYVIQKD